MHYVSKKRFILAFEPVLHIVEHRCLVSEKRSESKHWFGSKPWIPDTGKETANNMHTLEETNKRKVYGLHKMDPTSTVTSGSTHSRGFGPTQISDSFSFEPNRHSTWPYTPPLLCYYTPSAPALSAYLLTVPPAWRLPDAESTAVVVPWARIPIACF
jgi:hypothetical protein